MPPTRFSIAFAAALGMLLTGCFDNFRAFTFFPHSQFVTVADVNLRSGQDDDSSIVARIPKGTIVTPIGQTGSHCNACAKVDTPQGVDWLYTYYLEPLPLTE